VGATKGASADYFDEPADPEKALMVQMAKKRVKPTYPAEKASQGETILRRPWQRAVFIGGIAAALLLPLIVLFIAR
jgi:hypothetical protein